MDESTKNIDNSNQKEQSDNFFVVKSDPDVKEFINNILNDSTKE